MKSTTPLPDKALAYFWSKVALPNEDGCMLWLGNKSFYRYGRMRVQGRFVGAHRIALFLAVGEPPAGKPEGAHSCRNRHCCAPAHLRWADRKEQAADKERDGTTLRGDLHGRAKLTADQVREIRVRYARGGTTQGALGEAYGVQQAAVSKIVLGRKWRTE